ncbi:MAG: ankyrin repeat domain-containing protein [Alphaproteobacteria bacterium]|nr:ankyrin repeat domain-containing protein [Alphaproteobacteria bacterium]
MAVGAAFAALGPAQAKLNLFGDLPIVEAIKEDSLDATKKAIIDGASVHSRAADGTPVILLAVGERNIEIVKLLVENGARPDDRSKKDETSPLTLASANGDLEIVIYLLDRKADVDLPGALRETALIKATRAHHNDVIRLLLERGANTDDTDSAGATALEIAQRAGWKDTEALFKTKKATTK